MENVCAVGALPENNCVGDARVKFVTNEEVSEWLDEESFGDYSCPWLRRRPKVQLNLNVPY